MFVIRPSFRNLDISSYFSGSRNKWCLEESFSLQKIIRKSFVVFLRFSVHETVWECNIFIYQNLLTLKTYTILLIPEISFIFLFSLSKYFFSNCVCFINRHLSVVIFQKFSNSAISELVVLYTHLFVTRK